MEVRREEVDEVQFEIIPDEDQHKREDTVVAELLKAGWLPNVEYVARYEAVGASGVPLDEATNKAEEGYPYVDSPDELSVQMEYGDTLCRLHGHPRNLVAWVRGRIPRPEEARRILDEHGLPGTPDTVTPDDVTVKLD